MGNWIVEIEKRLMLLCSIIVVASKKYLQQEGSFLTTNQKTSTGLIWKFPLEAKVIKITYFCGSWIYLERKLGIIVVDGWV